MPAVHCRRANAGSVAGGSVVSGIVAGGSVARGSVVSGIMASGSDEKKIAFTVVGETPLRN